MFKIQLVMTFVVKDQYILKADKIKDSLFIKTKKIMRNLSLE